MHAAVARGNAAALRRAAHTVKGAVGHFVGEAFRTGARLESLAAAGTLDAVRRDLRATGVHASEADAVGALR